MMEIQFLVNELSLVNVHLLQTEMEICGAWAVLNNNLWVHDICVSQNINDSVMKDINYL